MDVEALTGAGSRRNVEAKGELERHLQVEVVRVEEVVEEKVRVVVGVVALEAMESVLLGAPKILLKKLSIGFCCRSHRASARGASVGCKAMLG